MPKSLKSLILADNPVKATQQFTSELSDYLTHNQQLTLLNFKNCLLGFNCISKLLP